MLVQYLHYLIILNAYVLLIFSCVCVRFLVLVRIKGNVKDESLSIYNKQTKKKLLKMQYLEL